MSQLIVLNELATRMVYSAIGGAQHHVQDDEDDNGAETAATELPGTETGEQTTSRTLHEQPLVIRHCNIRARGPPCGGLPLSPPRSAPPGVDPVTNPAPRTPRFRTADRKDKRSRAAPAGGPRASASVKDTFHHFESGAGEERASTSLQV